MAALNTFALIISLAALFSYINHRYLRLPTTIGLMLIGLCLSLLLLLLGSVGWPGITQLARDVVGQVDFNLTLMQGMLSFLLFAGALHVNINDLAQQKGIISILATVGVVLSTALIGGALYLLAAALDNALPLIYCLLFGALISPTDPIAVLGILRQAGAPKTLEAKISGESLFNDGVGVVVFIALLGIATGGEQASAAELLLLFVGEAIGGVLLGLALGATSYSLLRSIDNYQVEILLTLAVVMGGYSLANALHTSGPIAMVVAGLFLGNHGRLFAMSETTRAHLDMFWELVDEILNAVLFVLLGLEFLLLDLNAPYLLLAAAAIPLALGARMLSVGLPISLLRRRRAFSPHVVKILTWGGLRGGISIALAMSLPTGEPRNTVLVITYVVVAFSILVQGLTIHKLLPARSDNT